MLNLWLGYPIVAIHWGFPALWTKTESCVGHCTLKISTFQVGDEQLQISDTNLPMAHRRLVVKTYRGAGLGEGRDVLERAGGQRGRVALS